MLARLVAVAPEQWVLKGGFALDLRLDDRARSTKDIDLAWMVDAEELLDVLIEAATHDLGDYFNFAVERTDDSPERFGGTVRFRVSADLAGRPFETFVVDVGAGLDDVGSDVVMTPDLLGFAGIAPVAVPAISLEGQVAEKLHAYTRSYEGGRVSSRVKDLVALVLIAQWFTLDGGALRHGVNTVFSGRALHRPPPRMPSPPEQWQAPYRRLADAVGLDGDIDRGHDIVCVMLDPILDGRLRSGEWCPDLGQWADGNGRRR
nr:nucleotidyl transferase AbiEii/AbiGii toxin family protein [Jiangella mangrovi]